MGSLLRNRSVDYKRQLSEDFNQKTLPLLESGKIKGIVGKIYEISWEKNSVENFSKAFELMKKNENLGRIVFKFN